MGGDFDVCLNPDVDFKKVVLLRNLIIQLVLMNFKRNLISLMFGVLLILKAKKRIWYTVILEMVWCNPD